MPTTRRYWPLSPGPVWQATWSHPQYGPLLASCSYDGKVLIWKESTDAAGNPTGQWQKLHEHALHTASVNSVAWAPHDLGCYLACGSSDGKVSILTWREDGAWVVVAEWLAHQVGCNAVSWAPGAPSALIASAPQQAPVRRLATAGCDHLIKLWKYINKFMIDCGRTDAEGQWVTTPEQTLQGHTDWVRDVSFAPNIGVPLMLASCAQDKMALVWSQDATGQWVSKSLRPDGFAEPLWRVSWSIGGQMLAISGGDHRVSLWKMNLAGGFDCVSDMDETQVTAQ